MQSIILKKVSKLLLGISLILAVFFLLRGHHKPGGGFIGGILASAGFIFYAMIHGTKAVEKLIHILAAPGNLARAPEHAYGGAQRHENAIPVNREPAADGNREGDRDNVESVQHNSPVLRRVWRATRRLPGRTLTNYSI